jgi:hypothetical protein
MEKNTIVRHGPPSNSMDQCPKDTYCKVLNSDKSFDLWIQVSSKEDEPCWQFVDSFPVRPPEIDEDLD